MRRVGNWRRRGDEAHMCSCDCTHTRTCATNSNAIQARKRLVTNKVVRFLMISPLAVLQWSLNLRVVSGSDIKNRVRDERQRCCFPLTRRLKRTVSLRCLCGGAAFSGLLVMLRLTLISCIIVVLSGFKRRRRQSRESSMTSSNQWWVMHNGLDRRNYSVSRKSHPVLVNCPKNMKKTTAANTFWYTLIGSRSHFSMFHLLHYVHHISLLLHTMSQQWWWNPNTPSPHCRKFSAT